VALKELPLVTVISAKHKSKFAALLPVTVKAAEQLKKYSGGYE
jgi:hypothetical protein